MALGDRAAARSGRGRIAPTAVASMSKSVNSASPEKRRVRPHACATDRCVSGVPGERKLLVEPALAIRAQRRVLLTRWLERSRRPFHGPHGNSARFRRASKRAVALLLSQVYPTRHGPSKSKHICLAVAHLMRVQRIDMHAWLLLMWFPLLRRSRSPSGSEGCDRQLRELAAMTTAYLCGCSVACQF